MKKVICKNSGLVQKQEANITIMEHQIGKERVINEELDLPPAPPVRLTSCSCNRGANDRLLDSNQVDLKPLPKGENLEKRKGTIYCLKLINFPIFQSLMIQIERKRH